MRLELTLAGQQGGVNQAAVGKCTCQHAAALQREADLRIGECRNVHGHQSRAQIGLVTEGVCRPTFDPRIVDVDGVRNQSRSGNGLRCGFGKPASMPCGPTVCCEILCDGMAGA
jgi:hypothetical protein